MAIGSRHGVSWPGIESMVRVTDPDDWMITEGTDPRTWMRWFTIRIKVKDGVLEEMQSAEPSIHVPPDVLEQKLALLKVAPVGTKIDRVGLRRTEDIFYLRVYEDDVPLGDSK